MSETGTETQPQAAQPQPAPAQKQDAKAPAVVPQPAPAPAEKAPEFGKQFAALGRRESELRKLEAKIQSEREQFEAQRKEYEELEKLSSDQLLARVAKKRGLSDESDIIKDYLAKKTGQPTGEQAIKESKDPAVQALYEQLATERRERAALQEKLDAEAKAKAELAAQANVQMVQTECLQSASDAWNEEGDLPDFFDNKSDLAGAILNFCAERVVSYEKQHGFSPDEEDIQKLIKAAPEIILGQLKETPRGKRILARKAAPEPKPELLKQSKLTSVRMKPVPQEGEQTGRAPNQPIRTRYDNSDAIANARAMLPERIEFGAKAKTGTT